MADGEFDPCECIWSHEMAMRRLLSLLRQSQGYCTDNECYNESPGPNNQDGISDSTLFITVVWTVLALALFFLRPSSLRDDTDEKPSRQDEGSQPPPSVN